MVPVWPSGVVYVNVLSGSKLAIFPFESKNFAWNLFGPIWVTENLILPDEILGH